MIFLSVLLLTHVFHLSSGRLRVVIHNHLQNVGVQHVRAAKLATTPISTTQSSMTFTQPLEVNANRADNKDLDYSSQIPVTTTSGQGYEQVGTAPIDAESTLEIEFTEEQEDRTTASKLPTSSITTRQAAATFPGPFEAHTESENEDLDYSSQVLPPTTRRVTASGSEMASTSPRPEKAANSLEIGTDEIPHQIRHDNGDHEESKGDEGTLLAPKLASTPRSAIETMTQPLKLQTDSAEYQNLDYLSQIPDKTPSGSAKYSISTPSVPLSILEIGIERISQKIRQDHSDLIESASEQQDRYTTSILPTTPVSTTETSTTITHPVEVQTGSAENGEYLSPIPLGTSSNSVLEMSSSNSPVDVADVLDIGVALISHKIRHDYNKHEEITRDHDDRSIALKLPTTETPTITQPVDVKTDSGDYKNVEYSSSIPQAATSGSEHEFSSTSATPFDAANILEIGIGRIPHNIRHDHDHRESIGGQKDLSIALKDPTTTTQSSTQPVDIQTDSPDYTDYEYLSKIPQATTSESALETAGTSSYPFDAVNVQEIGIDRILHKFGHDHDHKESTGETTAPMIINRTFVEIHGLEDDEDYIDDQADEQKVKETYPSSTMTTIYSADDETVSTQIDLEHSGFETTTTIAELEAGTETLITIETPTSTSTTTTTTTTTSTATTTTTTTEISTPKPLLKDNSTKIAFENIDPEQFLIHDDTLNRTYDELRELLGNTEHLTMSYGSSSRDYGSSYIIPVLKSIRYDNNSVPLIFPDLPVYVLVQLNIIHLANFDSQQMEYTIDLELKMRWFDLRLANKYPRPVRIREQKVLELIWRPDPYFVNSKYSYFHLVSFPNFRMRVMPNGLVSYTMRVTLLPACQMVFCRFPHDRQQCDLMISSIAFPRQMVNLIWSDTAVDFATRLTLPELKITKMVTETCAVEGKLIDSTCLRLVFFLERDGGRFIVEKYIPSTLAMMFAWVAPYVPYNYEDVRIITPITVLLTLVQMEKGDEEVRTSYLTSLDTWFAAMKAFSVLSLVESLFVLALVKRSRAMEKEAQNATNQLDKANFILESKRIRRLYHHLDNIARFLSPIFFILFFAYYVLFVAQGDEHSCVSKNYGLF